MKDSSNFTEGKILKPLLLFAGPVLLAMLLQSMYGAVDLVIVGKYASTADISGVSTGSQFMNSVISLVAGLATGVTVLLGQKIGERDPISARKALGSGIFLFGAVALLLTAATVILTGPIVSLMNTPEEAVRETADYIRICGCGILFIVAFNLLGSIFRGLGDSVVPLLTVAIACVVNIGGDLLAVKVLGWGSAGAAAATVLAQAVSVIISLVIIRSRPFPVEFSVKDIRPVKSMLSGITRIGAPIALQDVLVSVSFLVLLMIVNGLGLVASAGVGVAEKICAFVMLIPSACSQSMSAFVAQNIGAGKPERAKKALRYGIEVSLCVSVVIFYIAFFHGDMLARVFANDGEVIFAASEYLKAYAIDCLMTSFLFCFIGYFSGCGRTNFVLIQGLVGAFGIRIPVAYLVTRRPVKTLFHVGLATPCSTVIQIILCFGYLTYLRKKERKNDPMEVK